MASEAPWRSLHPASLAVNLMPQAWRVLKGFWPVILFSLINQQKQSTSGSAGDFVVFLLFVLLSVFNTVVHFLTLRYRVSGGRLEVRQGLLNRSARSIDPSRIQNVMLVQNLFHRAAGLMELRVERRCWRTAPWRRWPTASPGVGTGSSRSSCSPSWSCREWWTRP